MGWTTTSGQEYARSFVGTVEKVEVRPEYFEQPASVGIVRFGYDLIIRPSMADKEEDKASFKVPPEHLNDLFVKK